MFDLANQRIKDKNNEERIKKISRTIKESFSSGRRKLPIGKLNSNYKPELHVPITKKCLCGCGNLVTNRGARFIFGHFARSKYHPNWGKHAWNRGHTSKTDQRVAKMGWQKKSKKERKKFGQYMHRKSKGRIFSNQHKKNLSISNVKAWMEGKRSDVRPTFRGHFRRDLGHRCRSTWEANICRMYKLQKIDYQYEPKRFLTKFGSYCPDIFLPKMNVWVEIKGHAVSSTDWKCICAVCRTAKKKIRSFKKLYKIILILIGKKEYDKLTKEFSCRIAKWEK